MSDLPAGWEWATLEELTDVARPVCYGILMPKEHIEDGVPYVKVKDFSRGPLDVSNLRRTAPEIAAKYKRSSLLPGDVLVSIRGTYGRVAIVPEALKGANVTQDTARLAPVHGVGPRYLAGFLASPGAQEYFKRVARGVAVKGVNIGDLRRLLVPVAPSAEQERIVAAIEEHLSRLDAAEASLRSALSRMEQILASARATLFAEPWLQRPLHLVAETQLGKMLSSKSKTGKGSTPYLRNRNVRWGSIELSDVAVMDFSDKERRKFMLAPGDVLICEGGAGVGRAATWSGELELCCYQKALHRVRTSDELMPDFLVQYMRYLVESRRLDQHLSGVAIGHFPQEDLRRLKVPVPPVAAQQRFLEAISLQESLSGSLQESLNTAIRRSNTLRRQILAAAFSGQLMTQNAADEPASVLVERMRDQRAAGPAKTGRQKVRAS